MKIVLVLENEVNDTELILRALQNTVLVCPVRNRHDYVTALVENEFDLIITDLNVATFLDFETVILARTKQAKTPLIVLTGSVSEVEGKKSLLAGASYFIMKNDFKELKEKVKLILNI